MVTWLTSLGAQQVLTEDVNAQEERCVTTETHEGQYPGAGLNAGACGSRAAMAADAVNHVVTKYTKKKPVLFSLRDLQKRAKELWRPQHTKGHSKRQAKKWEDEDPEEDIIGVEAAEEELVVDEGEPICGIVGTENNTLKRDELAVKLVGILVMPSKAPPHIFSSSKNNIFDAIKKRCTDKQRPCTLTNNDKAKIKEFVNKAISKDGPFSESRVRRFFDEVFDLESFRSGKWLKSRFWAKIHQLFRQIDPKFDLKTMIKLEPMPPGKPPRFLIADGDEGQIMSMLSIKCFEFCLYGHMPRKHVKHVGRREAAESVVAELEGLRLVEGDGSAWDTTCNNIIRALLEGPVLEHITKIADEYCILPSSWTAAHIDVCADEWLKLIFKDKYDTVKIWIRGQRRSGHAGTSCLNWWVNYCMWVCSLFKEPWRMLNDKICRGVDVTGAVLTWAGKFEGDDSLVGTNRDLLSEACNALRTFVLEFWSRAGFDMKFVFPLYSGDVTKARKTELRGATVNKRATFCGMHYAVNEEGKLTSEFCPEIPRAFANGGTSCSPEGRQAFMQADVYRAKQVARACALGRALDFAGISPMLSTKYLRYADSLGVKKIIDGQDARDVSFKLTGKADADLSEIESKIWESNAGKDHTDDLKLWLALGFEVSELEWDVFYAYEWNWKRLTAFDEFQASLPRAFV